LRNRHAAEAGAPLRYRHLTLHCCFCCFQRCLCCFPRCFCCFQRCICCFPRCFCCIPAFNAEGVSPPASALPPAAPHRHPLPPHARRALSSRPHSQAGHCCTLPHSAPATHITALQVSWTLWWAAFPDCLEDVIQDSDQVEQVGAANVRQHAHVVVAEPWAAAGQRRCTSGQSMFIGISIPPLPHALAACAPFWPAVASGPTTTTQRHHQLPPIN